MIPTLIVRRLPSSTPVPWPLFSISRTVQILQQKQKQQAPTRQTRSSSSRSSSSAQYLSRQSQDPFVKARTSPSTSTNGKSKSSNTTSTLTPSETFVARSAFKLLQLQAKYHGKLLRPGMNIVDLGAAPGGWCQAAHGEMSRTSDRGRGRGKEGKIIAVDLLALHQAVASLDDVHFIRGDFLDPRIQARISDLIRVGEGTSTTRKGKEGKVDLVLSDMLSNLSGNPLRDAQLSQDLCSAALSFALSHLTPPVPRTLSSQNQQSLPLSSSSSPLSAITTKERSPPSLVMKSLQSDLTPLFKKELEQNFDWVKWEKPTSSRPESREGFWVCGGLKLKGRGKKTGEKTVTGKEEEEEGGLFF